MTKWIIRLGVLALLAFGGYRLLGGQATTRAYRITQWSAQGSGFYNPTYEMVAVRDGTTVCYVVYTTGDTRSMSPAVSCVK